MRIYNPNCKYSVPAPLRSWKRSELLKQVPKKQINAFNMKKIPEPVLQDLLLTEYGTTTDLLGQTEKTYAVELTWLPTMRRADIWDELGEFIFEKQVDNEHERQKLEAQKEAERKAREAREEAEKQKKKKEQKKRATERKNHKEEEKQCLLHSLSACDVFYATIEYYPLNYVEAIKRYVYDTKPMITTAIIVATTVFIGTMGKDIRPMSDKIKVLEKEKGSIDLPPKKYLGVWSNHRNRVRWKVKELEQKRKEYIEEEWEKERKQKEKEQKEAACSWQKQNGDLSECIDAQRREERRKEKKEDEAKRHVKDQQAEHERYMTETYGPDWKIQLEKFLKEDKERRKLLIEKYGPDWQNYTG